MKPTFLPTLFFFLMELSTACAWLLSIAVLHLMHLISPQAAAPPNTTDHIALLHFKSLITSTEALASWNQSSAICEWPGITCGNRTQPSRVTELTLSSVNLGGILSPFLANLTFLERLYLPENNLHGVIPEELGQLQWLKLLNLSANSLEGQVPRSLSNCSILTSITLWKNKLSGEIPSEMGWLQNLQMLSLRDNYLTGVIPPSIGNISSLTALRLSSNRLKGSIPPELGQLARLETLDLLLNQLSGKIPQNLYNFSYLTGFGLGRNNLTGTLPSNMGDTLPRLRVLHMYSNFLEGPIPSSLGNASSLEMIEFNNNSFIGIVPSSLGALKNLTTLRLGQNKLVTSRTDDWNFMTSLTNCRNLIEIDLQNNNLSGSLPHSIANLSRRMDWLNLQKNTITGSVPIDIGNLKMLTVLGLAKNLLSGTIPDSLGKLSFLASLLLNGNKLSGVIPKSLGNLTELNIFDLSENKLSGFIPESLVALKNLDYFDLSFNDITGTIPIGLLSTSVSIYLNLSHNSLSGSLPEEVGSLVNLKELDLSENKFFGGIPFSFGKCIHLEYLNLTGNSFNGSIPGYLSNLRGIQVLDLSRNHLSGSIPESLATLPVLQHLNLSFNDLEGEVSSKGHFCNKTTFSIIGNKNLCGGCPEMNLKACSRKKHGLPVSVKIVIIVCVVVFVVLLCFCLFHTCFWKQKLQKRKSLSQAIFPLKDQFLKISYAELCDATNGFSDTNLIGAGGFGSVYTGILEHDKMKVAVKVLNQEFYQASKSFMTECRVNRNIRHHKIVKIITACSTVDFKGNEFQALVYEYVPNGNLDTWLHAEQGGFCQRKLNIWQRLNIAIDVASALNYLHNEIETPIVHSDLKPSNILLRDDMSACVCDFGIARFLFTNAETGSIGVKGSIGYIPPECGMGSNISTMWDVYSYGIILLEMFTGRRPTDENFKDGLSLRTYAEESFPQSIMDIIDERLVGREENVKVAKYIQESMISIIKIALSCSNDLPKDRMPMIDAIRELITIKNTFSDVGGKANEK